MKTVLKGYEDKVGKGKYKYLATSDVPLKEQLEILNEAKRLHKFPKGIQRIELVLEQDYPSEVAVFSDEQTAKGLQDRHSAFQKAEAEKQKAVEESKKQAKQVETNRDEIISAATERNKLLGEKHQLEIRIRNLGLAIEHKVHEAGAEKKIKELQAELQALAPNVEAAIAKYESLVKPGKSQPETKNTVSI